MRSLHEIEACFQGVVPSYLATCSAAGEPNVTYVSIVHLLSPSRVGISCQFMNKTLANLRETGWAQIHTLHPPDLAEYRLDLQFIGMVDRGPLFEKMAATLDGIASQSGMTGVFSLAGVAELEVLDWRKTVLDTPPPSVVKETGDPIGRLERITAAMEAATDVDALFDGTFAALHRELGLEHGFLLLADGANERLYNVASFGFAQGHFGAEIAIGEGLYGTAAARKISVRTGSMSRERLMVRAVARESAQAHPTQLALPGLADAESSLAVPLLLGERCLGVLCFQSAEPGAFTESHEKTVLIVARQLAAMTGALGAPAKDVEVSARRGAPSARATRVKYFDSDGSVFVDEEYLIKGVAGRILFVVLSSYLGEHRDEFSNKEMRLDPKVGLPALNDNLEVRLIALRKRLEERTNAIRIAKAGRGRFRLEVAREVSLERRP